MNIKKIKKIKLLIVTAVILTALILTVLNNSKNKDKTKQSDYILIENEKNNKNTDGQDDPYESTTTPETKLPVVKKLTEDYEFAKRKQEDYKEYPWYTKTPIETDGYFLIWVLEEKSFRIRLKISEKSPEEQRKNLINQALKDVEELTGMSYENYPYYVLYTEEK